MSSTTQQSSGPPSDDGAGRGSAAPGPDGSADAPAGAGGAQRPPLLRSPRQKVVAGVCGGLGRYCDVDPMIFRIVVAVLAVTGGLGLVFYGLVWLIVPMEGEDENEARRLLAGRVDGAALIAVLVALVGCGLFLSMLGNGGTLSFALMLTAATSGAAVWSQRRRAGATEGQPLDPAAAQAAAEAPPETTAPPVPDGPSWWRDPIIKDGNTGPVGTPYLWGPGNAVPEEPEAASVAGVAAATERAAPRGGSVRRAVGIGGLVFVLALIAGGLTTSLTWHGEPLGTSLEAGLSAALAVFGLGLVFSAFLGRTGGGTVFLTTLTTVLLVGAALIPKDIGTSWHVRSWSPTSVSAVRPVYAGGSGMATLDLGRLAVPPGRTVSTSVRMAAGELRVIVPPGATVRVHATSRAGDVLLAGDSPKHRRWGLDESVRRTLAPNPGLPGAGTLTLDLRLTAGHLEVDRAAS